MTLTHYAVYWSPEGRCIAHAEAESARAAIRLAPLPYRKFLGELYAVPLPSPDHSPYCRTPNP